jgi:hypothetical protein
LGEADDGATVDFELSADLLGLKQLRLVDLTDQGIWVQIPQHAGGGVITETDEHSWSEILSTSGTAHTGLPTRLLLAEGETLTLALSDFWFVLRRVEHNEITRLRTSSESPWHRHAWVLGSLAFHALLLGVLALQPPSAASLWLGDEGITARSSSYSLVPLEPPPAVASGTSASLRPSAPPAHRGPAGAAGAGQPGPSRTRRPARASAPPAATTATSVGILGILRGASANAALPPGFSTADTAESAALQGVWSEQVGDDSGMRGLDGVGPAPGGGGDSDRIASGPLHTITGSTLDAGPHGPARRGLPATNRRSDYAPDPFRPGTPEVVGGLAMAVIRREVRRHLPEVRYCYEQALTRRGDIAGRVTVEFVITPQGSVLSPHLELHTVEMTKFPDLREGQEGEKWLYWLKHGHEMTEQEVARLGVPEILEAERKLAMISQDRQVRVDYERRRMAHHDAVSLRRDSWLEGHGEGLRQGLDQGQHRALVDALVAVLKAREFPVSDELRARLAAETELARLKRWVARAAVVATVSDLLAE